MSDIQTTQNGSAALNRDGVKRIFQVLTMVALLAVVLFLSAGRLDWLGGWLYIGLVFGGLLVLTLVMLPRHAETINRRGRQHADAKRWDKVWNAVYMPMAFVTLIVAGLDAGRFGWSTMPVWLAVVGALLMIVGGGFASWAMMTNTHFETHVRIQEDRDHKPITSGPYRIVRHPGYSGAVLMNLGTPFVLGSWWMFVPVAVIVAMFVWRTAREDRTLHNELTGYSEYAQQTHDRLLPGVW